MDHQELLKRLESLLEKTEGAAFVVPADTGHFSIDDHLMGRVQETMGEAVSLLREISDFYDQVGASEGEAAKGDDLLGIGAMISSELAAREVASLAFAGRSQIVESRDALTASGKSRQIWLVASHADTGLRRIGKALIAVETAIREYEGLMPRDRHWGRSGSFVQDSSSLRSISPGHPAWQGRCCRGGASTRVQEYGPQDFHPSGPQDLPVHAHR